MGRCIFLLICVGAEFFASRCDEDSSFSTFLVEGNQSHHEPLMCFMSDSSPRATLARIGVHATQNPQLYAFLDIVDGFAEIEKIDHCTFVTAAENREAFLAHWAGRGFEHHGTWKTPAYPADHIALIRGGNANYP